MSKREMSDAHKQAMAAGRDQGRAVKAYLNALAAHRPKRGRKRTVESIHRRLAEIDAQFDRVDAFKRVALAQERIDLTREAAELGTDPAAEIGQLEEAFVKIAKAYSDSKGISRAAWRQVGVQPQVLDRAGIR